MRLTDLVEKVKDEQRDEKQAKLSRDRTAILRDLRRGLSEEEYQALASELKPTLDGYVLVWKGREVTITSETAWGPYRPYKVTEAKYAGGRSSLGWSTKIKSGRDLLEFLAGVQ